MRFYIVDVFAEQKYQGNQLAVFIPDKGLAINEMQSIAREINFAETTFITSDKRSNGGYDVRIFTPDIEVPFAGHPTLGTAFVIHTILEQSKSSEVILNLLVGQISVKVAKNNKEFMMQQNEPAFSTIIDSKMVAEVLNIEEMDINTDFPVQVVSTGLPAVIVPVKTLAAVKNCSINHDKYKDFIHNVIKSNLLVFTTEVEKKENDLHVRVFLDDSGFHEDAATGSANGNLAGYLLKYNFLGISKIQLQVEQGYEMGRYSLLKIDAEKRNEKYTIHVGGKVILIAQGEWL